MIVMGHDALFVITILAMYIVEFDYREFENQSHVNGDIRTVTEGNYILFLYTVQFSCQLFETLYLSSVCSVCKMYSTVSIQYREKCGKMFTYTSL